MTHEPIFRRGAGFLPGDRVSHVQRDETATSLAVRVTLNRAWDEINSLGGISATRSAKPYEAGFTSGFNRAIDDVLAILEQLGAEAPAQRLEHETKC